MVEEDLPRLAELVSFNIELVVEGLVEGDVEDGPEAPGVALLRLAALGAGSPPGSLEGVDVALPSATGADAAPHLLLEACGHGLLGLVGEVDRVPSFINAIGFQDSIRSFGRLLRIILMVLWLLVYEKYVMRFV